MSALAQELATYAALATAMVWLVAQWARRTRRPPACSKCSSVRSTAPSRGPRGRLHLDVVR